MKQVFEKIARMDDSQLREVLQAVERRYAEAFPEWDVLCIALHKDPALRKKQHIQILKYLDEELSWYQKKWEEKQNP